MPQEARRPAAESLVTKMVGAVSGQAASRPDPHRSPAELHVRIAATRILEARAPGPASRAPTGCPRLVPELSLSINALRAKNSSRIRHKRSPSGLSLAWTSISGESIAAPRVRRATLLPTQWAREAVISTLVSDVAPPTSNFVNSTCSSKSPGAHWLRDKTRCNSRDC